MSENQERQERDKRPLNRWTLAALVALVVVALLFQTIWKQRNPAPEAGRKLLWVQVIHGDGSVKDFDLNTARITWAPPWWRAALWRTTRAPTASISSPPTGRPPTRAARSGGASVSYTHLSCLQARTQALQP